MPYMDPMDIDIIACTWQFFVTFFFGDGEWSRDPKSINGYKTWPTQLTRGSSWVTAAESPGKHVQNDVVGLNFLFMDTIHIPLEDTPDPSQTVLKDFFFMGVWGSLGYLPRGMFAKSLTLVTTGISSRRKSGPMWWWPYDLGKRLSHRRFGGSTTAASQRRGGVYLPP